MLVGPLHPKGRPDHADCAFAWVVNVTKKLHIRQMWVVHEILQAVDPRAGDIEVSK